VAASDAAGSGVSGGSARGCTCCGRRCTRSVGITPLLIGCIATDRVHRDVRVIGRNVLVGGRPQVLWEGLAAMTAGDGRPGPDKFRT